MNGPHFHSRAQGVHGAGNRGYNVDQYKAVVRTMLAAEPGTVLTVEQLSAATGVPGRAIREILSKADGVDVILGGDGNAGYKVAVSRADAERMTSRLGSQVKTMADRLARRKAWPWPAGGELFGGQGRGLPD